MSESETHKPEDVAPKKNSDKIASGKPPYMEISDFQVGPNSSRDPETEKLLAEAMAFVEFPELNRESLARTEVDRELLTQIMVHRDRLQREIGDVKSAYEQLGKIRHVQETERIRNLVAGAVTRLRARVIH